MLLHIKYDEKNNIESYFIVDVDHKHLFDFIFTPENEPKDMFKLIKPMNLNKKEHETFLKIIHDVRFVNGTTSALSNGYSDWTMILDDSDVENSIEVAEKGLGVQFMRHILILNNCDLEKGMTN